MRSETADSDTRQPATAIALWSIFWSRRSGDQNTPIMYHTEPATLGDQVSYSLKLLTVLDSCISAAISSGGIGTCELFVCLVSSFFT